MEVIHQPNYDPTVVMPFVPAIKIKSGKLLWLAGTTALPVYHEHPHRREDLSKYMPVHVFVFRARPRMGDIGRATAIINSYFAPYNHKPTSTNLAVLELGEPEQLIEIQMVAVVD